jgi:exopolysaccharide biosynthesis polyprenyl glycosylphosphotransferase
MATQLVRVDHIDATPLDSVVVNVGEVRLLPAWKRTTDVVGAFIGLLVLAPVMLAVAIAVLVDSPGGPLFRQTRVGLGGRSFTCWKFRSMRADADKVREELLEHNEATGLIFKMKDDPRITRCGRVIRKTSLDELPQLWNVLRGDMSLVGPRPPLVSEVVQYEEHHLGRLTVTPGITGLWQVTSRNRHDFEEMVQLDVEYAKRMSFWFDITIYLRTISTVLKGSGSY